MTDAELVAAWPRVPDASCMWCGARGWCTWLLIGFWLLCDVCLEAATS